MNRDFHMFKLILEKAEEPEIKLPTSTGSWKKHESSRKTSIPALLTMPRPLCGSQKTVENSERLQGNQGKVMMQKQREKSFKKCPVFKRKYD